MTNQEVFDKVVAHLKAQGKQSLKGDSCKYRGSMGMKCAVGCLIPDEEYSSELEGKTVRSPELVNLPSLRHLNLELLWDLQGVHDRCDPPNWETKLLKVAKRFKLKMESLDDKSRNL